MGVTHYGAPRYPIILSISPNLMHRVKGGWVDGREMLQSEANCGTLSQDETRKEVATMETEENQSELYDSITRFGEKRSHVLPDVAAAADAVREAVYKDGVLSRKMKRLIAMAIALGMGCVPCIIAQTKRAVEAGATKEEVLEGASVLLAIRGTSGYSESWRVVKVLEELGMI